MGRNTTFTEKTARAICERLADGEYLRVICREDGMPSWRTVYDWIETRPDFAARIARARDMGADAIAEETLEIIDTEPERIATEHGLKIDPAFVQHQKNRVDQRMKLLSKWNPRYAEKVEHQHAGKGGGPIQMQFSATDAAL